MNPRPDGAPEPTLLILADISGYTRYMTANAKTLAHSQTIITELIQAIVREIELPLAIAKLEGDAIFLYCRKQDDTRPWAQTRRLVGEQLLVFFRQFGEKLAELGRSTTCDCNACTHMKNLRLKVIVHSGEVLFHRVLNFVELAGVDVIIVHRLLKNSVQAGQYLLLTEKARQDVELPGEIQLVESAEIYPDIGRIDTLVYLPDGEAEPSPARPLPGTSFRQRFGQSWKLYRQLWFAPFKPRPGSFRNLTPDVSGAGKFGFGMLTVLLTPVFLPVGAAFVALHALKPPVEHVHKADGSCCHKP